MFKPFGFNPDDIGPVIKHIHSCFPHVPIIAVGISFGGYVIINLLSL